MIVKLSEIFIPLSNKKIYSATELFALKLKPDFINKMATYFDLIYKDKSNTEGNLCFSENKEVRQEYRTTFSKADILEMVLSQLSGDTINVELEELVFSKNFFSA